MDNYQLFIINYQLIGDRVLGYGSRAIALSMDNGSAITDHRLQLEYDQ
jgi:hypothetical protein